jgi:adenosylcobinamide-GDP ribazoletransferase
MTTLPLGKPLQLDPAGMVPFFPLVGLLLGLITALADLAFRHLWPPGVSAVLDVVVLIVLSGALHLDGLGDTADGIFSHRGRERALEIMKDSRVGAMGLVAIVAVLGVKAAGLTVLAENRFLMLTAIPAFSRAGILFAMRALPYGRSDGGLGSPFFEKPLSLKSFWGVLPAAAMALAAGLTGLAVCIGFVLITVLLIGFYRRRMGCVTGDMLGAMIEVTEAFLLLLAATGF